MILWYATSMFSNYLALSAVSERSPDTSILWCVFQHVVGSIYYHDSMANFEPRVKLPKDSFFGYSMAYQQNKQRLIIGAPNAGTLGKVFSCGIKAETCEELDLVPKANMTNLEDTKSRGSSGHWLGATIKSIPSGLVVCAPRWITKFSGPKIKFSEDFGTTGRCFLSRSTGSASSVTQLPARNTVIRSECISKTHKALCFIKNIQSSLGWSLDAKGDLLVIGEPGIKMGMLTVQDVNSQHPSLIPESRTGATDREIRRTVKYNFGYAVAFGDFLPNKNVFAASSPYEKGKVLLLSTEGDGYGSKRRFEIERQMSAHGQAGARFGAVLCAVRRAGRGDALLVGAPAHAARDLARASHDAGAIVVLNPTSDNVVIRTIEGVQDGGMFGSAIANLGDIDGDDIDDVAISAPFEDGGSGAVYVYSGAALVGEGGGSWLQRIQPRGGGARGFGLSLHAFRDRADNRTCKDLAIGVPFVDRVAVVKCISTAVIIVYPDIPNLQNRSDLTYFNFKSCVNVTFSDKSKDHVMNITLSVTLNHNSSAAAKITEKGTTYSSLNYTQTLTGQQRTHCRSFKVLTPKNGDYDKEISYQILAFPQEPTETYDGRFVAVSWLSELLAQGSFSAADCNSAVADCTPTVTVTLTHTFESPYVIGSTKTEHVKIAVKNKARGAVYGACLRLRTEGVRLRVEGAQDALTYCESSVEFPTSELKCQLLISLRGNDTWVVGGEFLVETEGLTSASAGVVLRAAVYNHACAGADALQAASASVTLQAEPLLLEGSPETEKVVNFTWNDIEKSNQTILHIYTILNPGVTNWVNLNCDIGLEKKSYVNVSKVYIKDSFTNSCFLKNSLTNEYFCYIGNLRPQKGDSKIYVEIEISKGDEFENDILKKNALVTSYVKLYLNNATTINATLTTEILIIEAKVPLWIIVVAGVLGLLLLILIFWALKECGLFKRKHKERLNSLKKGLSNHRQSMKLQSRPQTHCEMRESLIIDENEITSSAEEHLKNNKKSI